MLRQGDLAFKVILVQVFARNKTTKTIITKKMIKGRKTGEKKGKEE